MRGDRAIVLDAPYRETANDQVDDQKRQSCKIGRRVAEIQGRTEYPPDQGGRDPDPGAAERGRKEYGRKIGREEYVRPDQ